MHRVQNFFSTSTDLHKTEATKWLGRRIELRKQVEQDPKMLPILKAHTEVMEKNRAHLGGFLWEISNGNKKIFLVGTNDVGFYSEKRDLPRFDWKEHYHSLANRWLAPEIKSAIDSCEKIYVRCALFPDQKELLIPEKEKFNAHFKEKLPPQKFNASLGSSPFHMDMGMDNLICGYGHKEKELLPIDDAQMVINGMQAMCNVDDTSYLEMAQELQMERFDAIQNQNLSSLIAVKNAIPQTVQDVIYAPTRACFESMKTALTIGDTSLFAIRADYCIGNNGLLELAEKQGLTITAMPLTYQSK